MSLRPAEDDALQSRARLPIGSLLRGKYRVDRVLGVGGMAVVYATTHRNTKRFAVKLLHSELALRPELRKRFVREGYVANSIEHPGVVSVLDDDVADDGAPFLVMELLDGASVEALARAQGPLSTSTALAIVDRLLDVLVMAHAQGVVHRDIKPSNLFLCRDGTLKLLDFGIARLGDATRNDQSSTHAGVVLGTPAFMAPEQALALPNTVDARTDIWAVGATLFTLLSGQQVHPGENPQQVVVRAASSPARSLAEVVSGAPGSLLELVDKALAFEPSARWESAQAMQHALRKAHEEIYGARELESLAPLVESSVSQLENAPTELSPSEQRPVSEAQPAPPRGTSRRRWLVAMALGVSLVSAALFFAGPQKTNEGVREPRRAAPNRATPTLAQPLAKASVSAPEPSQSPAALPSPGSERSGTTKTRPVSVPRSTRSATPPAAQRNPLDLELQ